MNGEGGQVRYYGRYKYVRRGWKHRWTPLSTQIATKRRLAGDGLMNAAAKTAANSAGVHRTQEWVVDVGQLGVDSD